ncbi:hypothetical protein MNBD_GAMMA22-1549 [hydrothermal vent metagenome]|uniref:Uncharacterized protein n=1 Tax=hydrothermal vent metagenome TaxID=652676 RepID=A0A3B1AGV0_9ZZZZ
MKGILVSSVIALLLSFQPVNAETVQMPNNSSSVSIEIPSRGMTMNGVEEHFGEPEAKKDAIGEPPITVWQYSNYTVYFEYKNVIHTVVNKS